MAFYEHVVITRPDISPAQVDSFVEELSGFLKEKGATIGKTEYWGLRNLAYPIKKQRKGHYSLINIDADNKNAAAGNLLSATAAGTNRRRDRPRRRRFSWTARAGARPRGRRPWCP